MVVVLVVIIVVVVGGGVFMCVSVFILSGLHLTVILLPPPLGSGLTGTKTSLM